MYDYVVDELPALIEQHFPVSDKRAIAGHSMGGHGALMIALKNPGRYLSASAFAPSVILASALGARRRLLPILAATGRLGRLMTR